MNADIKAVSETQDTWSDHCAYCGTAIERVEFTIERDGLCTDGPEVPLCNYCASADGPSCDEIWAKIANPEPVIEAIKEAQLVQEIVNEMRQMR